MIGSEIKSDCVFGRTHWVTLDVYSLLPFVCKQEDSSCVGQVAVNNFIRIKFLV